MDECNFFGNHISDMFNFDNEQNILNLMLMYMNTDDVLLLNDNDFERKILRYIKNVGSFTQNNGHDCPPPDYYSDEFSCMFDVLRINDSEVKKKNNPVLAKEKKAKKEFENALKEELEKDGGDEDVLNSPYLQIMYIADSSGNINEHSYPNYKRQAQRVIGEHIKKIPLWKKEHPNILHKGLLIFDETGLCIEATKKHKKDDEFAYSFDAKRGLIIHETWNDPIFMQAIYDSCLDFVIWFNPLKYANDVLYNYNTLNFNKPDVKYPAIVIVDARNRITDYKEFNYENLVMTT